MEAAFALVGLLLIGDLHSSWIGGAATWETNPIIEALARWLGTHAALAAVKCLDLGALGALYALWKRSAAHTVTAGVLCLVAVHYLPIVYNNYRG